MKNERVFLSAYLMWFPYKDNLNLCFFLKQKTKTKQKWTSFSKSSKEERKKYSTNAYPNSDKRL